MAQDFRAIQDAWVGQRSSASATIQKRPGRPQNIAKQTKQEESTQQVISQERSRFCARHVHSYVSVHCWVRGTILRREAFFSGDEHIVYMTPRPYSTASSLRKLDAYSKMICVRVEQSRDTASTIFPRGRQPTPKMPSYQPRTHKLRFCTWDGKLSTQKSAIIVTQNMAEGSSTR